METVSRRACYRLSETLKFESRSGRHKVAEGERGGGAGRDGASSQGEEQPPVVIGKDSIFIIEILSVRSEISVAIWRWHRSKNWQIHGVRSI
jgi:hypothetical protein